jgi:hypothetical protein
MIFLVLLLVLLFERLLDRPAGALAWILYGVAALFAVLLHYYVAVYVLALASLAFLARRREERRPRASGLLLVNGVALLAVAVYAGARIALFELETSQRYLRPFTPGELFRLAFGIGLARILRSPRERPEAIRLLVCLFVLPLFLLVLPWLGFPDTYVERSALPALPFFFLVAGAGLSALPSLAWRRFAGGLVLAISVTNLVAYFAFAGEWTVYKPHPDWRSVARYLGAEIDAGGAGRPVFTPVPNPRALPYYDPRIQPADNLSPSTEQAARLVRAIERRVPGAIGRFLAERAGALATRFEEHKAQLRAGARVFVHSTGDGSLDSLRLDERRRDGVLYLLKDRWHPPNDASADALLRDPGLRVLDRRSFGSITVYKLAEAGR